jgi:hypothetical protein
LYTSLIDRRTAGPDPFTYKTSWSKVIRRARKLNFICKEMERRRDAFYNILLLSRAWPGRCKMQRAPFDVRHGTACSTLDKAPVTSGFGSNPCKYCRERSYRPPDRKSRQAAHQAGIADRSKRHALLQEGAAGSIRRGCALLSKVIDAGTAWRTARLGEVRQPPRSESACGCLEDAALVRTFHYAQDSSPAQPAPPASKTANPRQPVYEPSASRPTKNHLLKATADSRLRTPCPISMPMATGSSASAE